MARCLSHRRESGWGSMCVCMYVGGLRLSWAANAKLSASITRSTAPGPSSSGTAYVMRRLSMGERFQPTTMRAPGPRDVAITDGCSHRGSTHAAGGEYVSIRRKTSSPHRLNWSSAPLGAHGDARVAAVSMLTSGSRHGRFARQPESGPYLHIYMSNSFVLTGMGTGVTRLRTYAAGM